jgi:hypothetical protein
MRCPILLFKKSSRTPVQNSWKGIILFLKSADLPSTFLCLVYLRNFNLNVKLFMSSKPQGIYVGYKYRKSYPLASLLATNPASDQKTSEKNRWQLTSAHFLILMENME